MDILKSTDEKKIFKYIKSLPSEYRLKSSKVYEGIDYLDKNVYGNGFDTAVNKSPISIFYKKVLKESGEATVYLPIPSEDKIKIRPYNNLNDLLKIVGSVKKRDYYDEERIIIIQEMLEIMMYEDFFPKVNEVGTSLHKYFEDILFTKSNYESIYNKFFEDDDFIKNKVDTVNDYPLIKFLKSYV